MKKDYKAEVEYLLNIIKSRCGLSDLSLLDVACGRGMHLKYLREYFGSEGRHPSETGLHIEKRIPSR